MDDKRGDVMWHGFEYEPGNRVRDLTDGSILPATDNGFRFKKKPQEAQ